jgi:hypothetical protein
MTAGQGFRTRCTPQPCCRGLKELEDAQFIDEAEELQKKLALVPSPTDQMPTGPMAPLESVRFRTLAANELPQLLSSLGADRLPMPNLIDDYEILRTRLMASQGTLYGEYDRLIAEAEFRIGISVPLIATVSAYLVFSAELVADSRNRPSDPLFIACTLRAHFARVFPSKRG